jgi:hypothetical protein
VTVDTSGLIQGEGFHKVTPGSIRSDLGEGAKIGNDLKNGSDPLLVKRVTGGLGAEGSQAWMNYFRYDAAKPANTLPVGQHPCYSSKGPLTALNPDSEIRNLG